MPYTGDLKAYIEHFVNKDKFGALMGGQFVSIDSSECIFQYEVNPQHFNPNGILHGGALYGVMDSSQGMFIHFILDDAFKAAATGTATIKYLAPLTSGRVKIRTFLKERQGRKYFINSVATDAAGKEVATLEEIWIAMGK